MTKPSEMDSVSPDRILVYVIMLATTNLRDTPENFDEFCNILERYAGRDYNYKLASNIAQDMKSYLAGKTHKGII